MRQIKLIGRIWTSPPGQCEILNQELLGGLPADEDVMPQDNLVQGFVPFDFFGFGRQVHEQQAIVPQDKLQQADNEDPTLWGQWLNEALPDAAPAAQVAEQDQVQVQPILIINAPEDQAPALDVMEIDDEALEGILDLNVAVNIEGEPLDPNMVPALENPVIMEQSEQAIPIGALEQNLSLKEVEHVEGQGEAFIVINDFMPLNLQQELEVVLILIQQALENSTNEDNSNDVRAELEALLHVTNLAAQQQNEFGPFLPADESGSFVQGNDSHNSHNESNGLELVLHPPHDNNLQIGWIEFQDTSGIDSVFYVDLVDRIPGYQWY